MATGFYKFVEDGSTTVTDAAGNVVTVYSGMTVQFTDAQWVAMTDTQQMSFEPLVNPT